MILKVKTADPELIRGGIIWIRKTVEGRTVGHVRIENQPYHNDENSA